MWAVVVMALNWRGKAAAHFILVLPCCCCTTVFPLVSYVGTCSYATTTHHKRLPRLSSVLLRCRLRPPPSSSATAFFLAQVSSSRAAPLLGSLSACCLRLYALSCARRSASAAAQAVSRPRAPPHASIAHVSPSLRTAPEHCCRGALHGRRCWLYCISHPTFPSTAHEASPRCHTPLLPVRARARSGPLERGRSESGGRGRCS